MADDTRLYLPWYEASPAELDELAQIQRVVAQLRASGTDDRVRTTPRR